MYLNWHDRAGEEPIILTARPFFSFSRNWPLFTNQSNEFFHYKCQVYVFFFELIVDFWNFDFTVYSCFLEKYCEYILEVWKIKANVIGVQSK